MGTGARVLVIENDANDPLGRLGDWLTAAGLDLEVVPGPDLPDSLDGYAGLVVMGGFMGAADDTIAPWLPHERSLLRAAITDAVPTLAVCLGAQLLAVAHGGRVGADPEQSEIGAQLVGKRGAASNDPLFRALPITPDVIQWHHDSVLALPPGAQLLASSPVCANEAFRLGRLAWALQFHIETTPEVIRDWATRDPHGLPADVLEIVVERAIGVHDDLAEVWGPFAAAFADIVREPDAVPPARGVATSTAAPLTDPAAIRAALAAEANAARAPVSMPLPTTRPRGDA